jgi:hypothetical protein
MLMEFFGPLNYNDSDLSFVIDEPIPMTFQQMEKSLKAYMAHPLAASDNDPVTFNSLPIIEDAYVPASLPAVRSGASKKKAADAAADNETGKIL